MEHAEYQELLGLEAVDALDGRDAQILRAHLDSCSECRSELAEMRDAAALLAHAAPIATPSEDVRRRIMCEIQSEPGSRATSNVAPFTATLPRARPIVWRLAIAAAFVALLFGTLVLKRREAVYRREVDELARQLNQQQRELEAARDDVARQTEALALLNTPDGKKMSLAGTPAAQTARATFVYDEKSRNGVLLVEGLPPTPADKAYEVWFIPKGLGPIPGRTFAVNANGRAYIADSVPPAAGSAMVVAITLEPKAGSTTPTMPIYLASPAS